MVAFVLRQLRPYWLSQSHKKIPACTKDSCALDILTWSGTWHCCDICIKHITVLFMVIASMMWILIFVIHISYIQIDIYSHLINARMRNVLKELCVKLWLIYSAYLNAILFGVRHLRLTTDVIFDISFNQIKVKDVMEHSLPFSNNIWILFKIWHTVLYGSNFCMGFQKRKILISDINFIQCQSNIIQLGAIMGRSMDMILHTTPYWFRQNISQSLH